MLSIKSGSFQIPHPKKVDRGGEDGYFTNDTLDAFGVADGVGGWNKKGIDPGFYARELMQLTEESILAGEKDPLKAVEYAFLNNNQKGSSTACVTILNDSTLFSLNIGDSGFIIIRDKKIYYSRQITVHSFNYPFQLGKGTRKKNVPKDGLFKKQTIFSGDIIVMGTDGLWDNLFEQHILEMTNSESNMQKLAENIAQEAKETSSNPKSKTPWSKDKLGGKPDDITVIAALIS